MALSGFAAAPAFAASDAVVVYGSVPYVCTISAPADNGSVNLAGGTTALGNLTAQCNDPQGFTASLDSLNDFKLAEAGNPSYFTYVLDVSGLNISSDQSINSNAMGPPEDYDLISTVTVPLAVESTTLVGPAYAGLYQDTITFTINGN